MKIIRKLVYIFFLIAILIAFVFFGGGRALIKVGEEMERLELAMKETLGSFCKQGEQKIKTKAGKVTGKIVQEKASKD